MEVEERHFHVLLSMQTEVWKTGKSWEQGYSVMGIRSISKVWNPISHTLLAPSINMEC